MKSIFKHINEPIMKNYLCIAIAVLYFGISWAELSAQRPMPEKMENRLEMIRKNFIQNRLELSEEEADAFWPVYDAHHRAMEQLEEKYRTDQNPMFLSDEEAQEYLDNKIRFEEEALDERKEFMLKVREVLPVRKTLFLLHLEEQFKKEMVQRIRERINQQRPNPDRNKK